MPKYKSHTEKKPAWKKIISFVNAIALVVGYISIISYISAVIYGNIFRYHKVDPAEACGMGATKVIVENYSFRSFNGDGASMVVWAAYPSTEAILRIVDRRNIEQGRIWFAGPFDDEARKAFNWLSKTSEYATIKGYAEQVVSGDFYYSFDRLNLQGDYIGNCQMWLVSPELRLIVFLDYDT